LVEPMQPRLSLSEARPVALMVPQPSMSVASSEVLLAKLGGAAAVAVVMQPGDGFPTGGQTIPALCPSPNRPDVHGPPLIGGLWHF
jgi:hypothetical protein